MRPLVAVRQRTPFDARFVAKSPLFWALARPASCLAAYDDFPAPSELDRVFEGVPPVRFVDATPQPRRHRRGPLDVRSMYDGTITLDKRVPTRRRSWHDLMNALVWGAFPRAKYALHTRQHRALSERVARGARALPPARTREQDALALVDEGGVVVLASDPASTRCALRRDPEVLREMLASGAAEAVIFGHAIYESLVFGVAPARVAALALPSEPRGNDLALAADRALADVLADGSRLRGPDELLRVDVRALELSRHTSTGSRGGHHPAPRSA
jgi:hypothetical protein